MAKQYFLAANSCEGFVSYFSTAYNPNDGWQAFIIKGGPGTGKSSFMKKLVKYGEDNGYKAEMCPCSSDPDSLDAVIFPEIKKIIMDGTAPHTVDPKYAGAVDTILNFGEYWNADILKQNTENIIKTTDKNKVLHKTAAMYLMAAGNLLSDNYNTQLRAVDIQKAKEYAYKICRKYLKGEGDEFKESVRFLSGISPKGIVSFPDTILEYTENPVAIKDNYGAVSNIIMNEIKNEAVKRKYKIIVFKNAFLPDLIDHIVVPNFGLAFVRESEYFSLNTDTRRIHAERFIDKQTLKSKRLKYNSKTARVLLNSAADTLKLVKSVHDDLEKLYINAMNYEKLDAFTESFKKGLF